MTTSDPTPDPTAPTSQPGRLMSDPLPGAARPHQLTAADHERLARLDGPVHGWFSLTYANYRVLHRSLMQSMPVAWQRRMVRCLDELDAAFSHIEKAQGYIVEPAREDEDDDGDRVLVPTGADPVPHYNRGRTYIEPLPPYGTAERTQPA